MAETNLFTGAFLDTPILVESKWPHISARRSDIAQPILRSGGCWSGDATML